MKPYYEDEHATIYLADWHDVAAELRQLPIDAVVSDPPYGIGADSQMQKQAQYEKASGSGGRAFGGKKGIGNALTQKRDYGATDWDQETPSEEDFRNLLKLSSQHIFWGGNYFGLPPTAGWLVWDKVNGANGFADCELAWTDLPMAVRMIKHEWNGMLRKNKEEREHPTQKPLDVMRWCLKFLAEDTRMVCDPYMGSGTTLRAAKDLGIRSVGVEREEKYCEIAVGRLAQENLF
jgi:DNA modification methylase